MGLFEKDDPKDEIRLQLAELAVKLADVRKQVGELSGEYSRIETRMLDAGRQSIELERYAKKALAAGNEQDARTFLNEKHKFDLKTERLKEQLLTVGATKKNAVELHDQIVRELNETKSRLAVLEARDAAAEVSLKYSKTAGSHEFEEKLSSLETESELREAMNDAKRYVNGDGGDPDGL